MSLFRAMSSGWRFLLLCATASHMVLPFEAKADTSLHALVVGNGAYQNKAHQLKNPTNDAKLMERTLRDLGFKVTLELDSSHRSMKSALVRFARSVPKRGLAFYYFAGHGISVGGENYLIPTDAELSERELVEFDTISQSMVLKVLKGSGSNLNVVVLDCCLNNPFQRSWTLGQSRGYQTRGLAAPQAMPEGTVIAYATDIGKTADDGVGQRNSPYTEELAVALSKRPLNGLMLNDVFLDVREAVLKRTKQAPWYSYKAGRFMLWRPEQNAIASATPRQPIDSEQLTNIQRPKSEPDLKLSSKDDRPADNSLLWQGDTFANEGNYELAIEAYSSLISESNTPDKKKLRHEARIARGSAYMQRGSKTNQLRDYQYALLDYRAAGRSGIPLAVRAESADLMIKRDVMGKLFQFQTAMVTQTREGWFWVESVQGNSKLQGWVSMDAFSEKPKEKAKATPRPPAQPSVQPSGSTIAQPKINAPSSTIPSSSSPGQGFTQQPGQSSRPSGSSQQTGRTQSGTSNSNNWPDNRNSNSSRPSNSSSSASNASGSSGYNNPNRPADMTSRGGGQGTLRGQQRSGQGNRGGRGRRQFGR